MGPRGKIGWPGVGPEVRAGWPGRGAPGACGLGRAWLFRRARTSALGGTTGRAAGCPANCRVPWGRGAMGAPGVNVGDPGALAGAGRGGAGVPGTNCAPPTFDVVTPAGAIGRVAGKTTADGASGGALAKAGAGGTGVGGGGGGATGTAGTATRGVSGIGCRGPLVVTPGRTCCGAGRTGTATGRLGGTLGCGVPGLASGG